MNQPLEDVIKVRQGVKFGGAGKIEEMLTRPQFSLPLVSDDAPVAQAQHAVGHASALGLPGGDLLEVKVDGLGGGHRVVAANLLDDTTVTRGAGIGDDDTVVRTLLSAVTSKANLDCQRKLLQPSSFRLQLQTNS